MSALIIDYSELQTIATNATSLASKAENYCNELNSTVYSAFGSVTAGVNDVLSSAMYYVAAKQKSLTEKAEEYARFAGNVCTLIEHAKQADQDVATKIENNQEDFLKKHSEIQAAEGIEAFLLNLFVEVKNACPLFEIVADCYIAVFDTLDSAFDALKYFYECGGGKELLNIVIAVAVAVVAVATFIACFPLSLAFSWAGLVALATVIGSGIAAVNAITDVLTSTRALESRLNGDTAWASIYGKQDKFSDVLRDTNFGSGTLNKLSYGAATTIDTVETVCDVICVADGLKDKLKSDSIFKDNLGINQENIDNVVEVKLSREGYPESSKHIEDAIADGKPSVLTIDRSGARQRRKESLSGIETIPGLDRDEYPPAMSLEGGSGASVRHISLSDNRGSGAKISHQLREYPNGTKYKIILED